jgi:hypothetical protein
VACGVAVDVGGTGEGVSVGGRGTAVSVGGTGVMTWVTTHAVDVGVSEASR